MGFNVKKIRPLFTGVVTTARRYVGDTTTRGGLLLDTNKLSGTMNSFQYVVAGGKMVTDLKEGDIVKINFKRYLVPKHLPGAIADNVQSDNLQATYEIPMVELDGIPHLFLQSNDIEFVVEEYDGIEGGGLLE